MNKQHTVNCAISHANSLILELKQLEMNSSMVVVELIVNDLEYQVEAIQPDDQIKEDYHDD